MNQHHAEILRQLRSKATAGDNRASSKNYLGNKSINYNVPSPELRNITREWLTARKSRSPDLVFEVVDSLIHGDSHEEKKIACYMLGSRASVRSLVSLSTIDQWLNQLNGWAEIDALCQNIFTVADVDPHWDAWCEFLLQLSKDGNINRRRASLVFLVGLTRKSDDERFHQLARSNIQALKVEKDVLITKAISWLLRCMIKTRREESSDFLDANADSLPAIAVRETRTKLKLSKKA